MLLALRPLLIAALLALPFNAHAEPLLLGVPEPTVELAAQEHVAPILEALNDAAAALLEGPEGGDPSASAAIRSLIARGEAVISETNGTAGRHMAAFQAEAAYYEWMLDDAPAAMERARRAVAIDRQMAANAAFFGRYLPEAALTDTVPAAETVLDLLFEMSLSALDAGDADGAETLRTAAFEIAQAGFVTRAPRRAVSRLRAEAELEEPHASTTRMVIEATKAVEAFAYYAALVEGGLLGQAGTPERAAADMQVAQHDAIVRQALALLRQYAIDVAAILLPQPVPYERVRSVLDNDQALLLVARGALHMHVFVATRDGLSWSRSDAPWLDYARRIPEMRAAIGVGGLRGATPVGPGLSAEGAPGFVGEAHWLYESLLGGSSEALRGRRHLLFAASDILSTFPLEALVVSPPSGATTFGEADWLVRHHAVTVIPAVESLVAPRPARRPAPDAASYFAFADPDYAAAAGLPFRLPLTRTVERLPPLPESGGEARAIAQLMPGTSMVSTGRDASEPLLKVLSDDGTLAMFRIIHFATHGLIPGGGGDVTEPGLALSPANEMVAPSALTAARYYEMHPDGFLTDTEVTTLRLDADLVVLSACDTSAEDALRIEGFGGLASAFLVAGARSVMASHWPVVSRAAVEIVTATLGRVVDGEEASEALRRAVLASIAAGGERADPRYWAPFSIYGAP